MLRDYDITGFVNFPNPHSKNIKQVDNGKTFIYLIAIDFNSNEFSKQILNLEGNYCGDDVTPKNTVNTLQLQINDIVDKMKNDANFEVINTKEKMVSSILLGWSRFSYQYNSDIQPWVCTFRELTNEGKKLYYSFKKLNYDKEVRMLTFNNI